MVEALAMLHDVKSNLLSITNLAIPAIKYGNGTSRARLRRGGQRSLSSRSPFSSMTGTQDTRTPRNPGRFAWRPAALDPAMQQEEAQGGSQVRTRCWHLHWHVSDRLFVTTGC